MLKTVDRLIQFINHIDMSARQFDISIGASNGYTLRMKKNQASIGSDVIETILKVYPQLNVAWLITGEGEMLKTKEVSEILEFEDLSKLKQTEIEQLIEKKIRSRQEIAIKSIIKEVSDEIEQMKKDLEKN
ncbi:hypothetical protein [Eudoraea chungangensis]|uniref:hypothetical protein n=1 Tax=Eudoraea chungangensis TaxID=1481905 RepID=UPI0023EDB299|nr:hypothetical protein [Eudoraea chungangensis]